MKDTYKTNDLQLAATLQSLGHRITKLEDHPEKTGVKLFVFDNTPGDTGRTPQEDSVLYLSRQLKVEPNELFQNNANLRAWVKNQL